MRRLGTRSGTLSLMVVRLLVAVLACQLLWKGSGEFQPRAVEGLVMDTLSALVSFPRVHV
jgi:hypothetical protein